MPRSPPSTERRCRRPCRWSRVPAWTPTFVADDDLGGVLNATSPLLSRAFGRVKGSGTRARPPG